MEWGGLPEWAKVAAQVSAILIAAGLLAPVLRPVARYLCSIYREVRFMFQQQAIHAAIDSKLDRVLGELKPNGGNSLRDAINQIQHQVDFFGSARRAQLNGAEVPMCETDDQGRLIWANKAYVVMAGAPEKALMGTGWVNVIAPNQREWAQEVWLRAVSEGREFDEVITYKKPDGSVFDARVMAHPIRMDSGKLFGYLAEVHPK